jgi:two-component system sensor kinase FixL
MILLHDVWEAIGETVPLLVADLETGSILYATRPCEEMFGFQLRNEMVGLSVDDLVPTPVRAQHAKHRSKYQATPRIRPMGAGLKLQALHQDGHTFPVEIGLSAAKISGTRCVIAVVIDMSERSGG